MFNFELVACPVCNERLGKRNKNECHIVKCTDCNVLWMWVAGAKQPKPLVGTKQPEPCGCGRCGR